MSEKKIEKISNISNEKKVEKNTQQYNNLEKKQEVIIEKNKLESDIHADIDTTAQRKDLALDIQKNSSTKELNTLKPEVVNNLGSDNDPQSSEDQESWFVRNKAWLIGAGGVGLGAWLLKPWNLFSDKETKEGNQKKEGEGASTEKKTGIKEDAENITVNVDNRQNKNWFQRNRGWLVGGAGVAGAGYYFKDKLYKIPIIGKYLDDRFGPDKLKFNEALNVVEAKVKASASENHLTVPSNLQRNETEKTITVFDHSVKVDIENRKIDGLDMTFSTYEELIATVMIIGAAKSNYSGMCIDNAVFSTTGSGGDIQVRLSKDKEEELVSGQGAKVGAMTGMAVGSITSLVAGYFLGPKAAIYTAAGTVPGFSMLGSATLDYNDTLSQVAPTLNDGVNKDKLCGYLNSMKCRSTRASTKDSLKETAKSENNVINKKFIDTLQKINDTEDPNDESNRHFHGARKPSIENYKDEKGVPLKDVIELNARDQKIYFKIETDGKKGVKKVIIEDSGIEFTGPNAINEALHLGLFINQCEKQLAGTAIVKESFVYQNITNGLESKDRGYAISFATNEYSLSTKWLPLYKRRLSRESIEKDIPDLLKGKNMDILCKWLNNMEATGNDSNLWVEGGKRKNTYLQKLQTTTTPALTNTIPESKQKKAA